MIQHSPLGTTPDAPRPTGEPLGHRPDMSTTPGMSLSGPTAFGPPTVADEGAQDAVDHVADSGAPAGGRLGEGVSSAADTRHAKADPLGEERGDWAAEARGKVQSSPLASVAVAFALGAVIYRLTH